MCEKGNTNTQFIVKNVYKDQAEEADVETAKRKLLELICSSMIKEINSLGGLQV